MLLVLLVHQDRAHRDAAMVTEGLGLTFGVEVIAGPLDPEQRIIVCALEPGSATARVLLS